MYINNTTNLLYRTNHKCEECSHYNVCKWTNDMKKIKDKANKINESENSISPIRVNISCNMFEGTGRVSPSPIKLDNSKLARDDSWFKDTYDTK